jgi:catechol 2,3-dioxygenase-like lactoylglutathione lyase family enzyme
MRLILPLALFAAFVPSLAQDRSPGRPPITGISHVAFYAEDVAAARQFYAGELGLAADASRQNVYHVGTRQAIEIEPLPSGEDDNRLAHVAFATTDAEGMRRYLAAHGIAVPANINSEANGTRWFALKDPEGHPIEFVQESRLQAAAGSGTPVSRHLIHCGFVVHDRALEDRFYKDLLGFHVYWYGGMKDGETDFIDMQVPDGTEWLEYMMMQPGQTPSASTLGVVNHAALGVSDGSGAVQILDQHGWKPSDREKLQIGRDGKWQLNLYDPDGTRVEVMEFRPTEKPCCSSYSGPHPE